MPIRTNSLGLRSAEVTRAKPAGAFRILALGDSVTFGWGLRGEDAYPSQLASLLATLRPNQHFEVINAGVSGYGTWQQARWLEETGLELAAGRGGSAGAPERRVRQPVGHAGLAGRRSRAGWRSTASWLNWCSGWWAAPPRAATVPCAADWKVGTDQVCWQRTEQLLSELRSVAQDAGATTVLMPSPMRWQVEPGVRDVRAWVDAARYQDVLRQYAERNGWIFVDPLPAFRQAYSSGQSLFLDVGHPNEAGQRLMAQELYNALEPSRRAAIKSSTTQMSD